MLQENSNRPMKNKLLILLLAALFALPVAAIKIKAKPAYKAGETLECVFYFNWKFVWVKAGGARLIIRDTIYNGQKAQYMSLLSSTNETAAAFFKMRDTLTCITTPQLEPLYFRKGAEEGSHYTVDEVRFGYEGGKCIVDQQRYRRGKGTTKTKEVSDQCVFDMLSILLQARSFDPTHYKVGDKILFPMATGRKVEQQTLIYRGKKKFKAEDGVKYRCLVFSLVEYDKDGDEDEVISFYVTDDRNHLPVRLDLYLNFGSAKAFLKTVKGNRYPLESIIE